MRGLGLRNEGSNVCPRLYDQSGRNVGSCTVECTENPSFPHRSNHSEQEINTNCGPTKEG